MSYTIGVLKFKVTAADATTATLTTGERVVGVKAETPSQIVMTWPTARPTDVVVNNEYLIQMA